MKHSLPEPNIFGAQERGVISSLSWRFYPGRTSLPRVSCLSPSGAWGIAVTFGGLLGDPCRSPWDAQRRVVVV